VSGGAPQHNAPDVYIVAAGDAALARGIELAEELRDKMPAKRFELNLGGGSFKSQLKRADKSGARFAVILGEQEVLRGEAGLKPLREHVEQSTLRMDDLAATLARELAVEK
jgi:histidyl-tRNA synthetase